jgi:hypothetical protein
MTTTGKRETEWERRQRRSRERAAHVAEHGPGCELCGNVPKRGGLHEDHDHKRNVHRGWLCHRCNRVLWNGITPEWCERAAAYLRRAAS